MINRVCLMPINSQKDIDAVFAEIGSFQLKISKILNFSSIGDIRQLDMVLSLGQQFKTAYFQSIGTSHIHQVRADVNAYQELLKLSFEISDRVTVLVIDALKCHQRAYEFFMQGGCRPLAIVEMKKSFECAEAIAKDYINLSEKFSNLREKIGKQTLGKVHIEHNDLAKTIRTWTDPVNARFQHLKKYENFLECSMDLLGNIQKKISYTELFLASLSKIYCWSLLDYRFIDPDIIEILEESITDTSTFEKGCSEIGAIEEALGIASPNTSLDNMKMKTGRVLGDAAQKPVSRMSSSLELEYEESYLKWLALAKVNRAIAEAMNEALIDVEKTQEDILILEKDPLFIAFCSHLPQ